jgi:hypothetical protein
LLVWGPTFLLILSSSWGVPLAELTLASCGFRLELVAVAYQPKLFVDAFKQL